MINRRFRLFKNSVVTSAVLALAFSGCTVGSRCHKRSCCQSQRVTECNCASQSEVAGSSVDAPVLINSTPYHLPSNFTCGCGSAEPATIQAPIKPKYQIQSPTADPANEYQAVPEVSSTQDFAPDPQTFSSRTARRFEETIKETISQMKAPLEEQMSDFEEVVATAPSVDPVSTPVDPVATPVGPVVAPIAEPKIATLEMKPLPAKPEEKPYYDAAPKVAEFPVESFQQFPAQPPEQQPKLGRQEPGAVFAKLAEEVFSEVDLDEDFSLQPLPQLPETPQSPVSTEPPVKQQAPEQVEEVFGAIQFDAVLRKSKTVNVYTQSEDNEPKSKEEVVLKAKSSEELESSDPTGQASVECDGGRPKQVADAEFIIRPLPKFEQQEFVTEGAAYEFRTMPAYHMPTLRAITKTEDEAQQRTLGKIRFIGLPADQIVKPERIQNQHFDLERKQVPAIPAAFPADPKPMIRSLPRFEKPAKDSIPNTDIEKVESIRGLTNRVTDSKPLR